MKKTLLFVVLLFGLQFSFASLPTIDDGGASKKEAKKEMKLTVMKEFSKLTIPQYESIRGKKLNFFEKITFKVTQNRVKQKLRKAEDLSEGFNVGGFFLGLILGLIGVLGAYLFSKDRNFRKWTWIGWGVWVAILLVALLL